jgi:tetratricopeptide (TPR) repeat protein
MKKKAVYIVLSLVFSFIVISCGVNNSLLQRLQLLEKGVDNPTTIDELTQSINKNINKIQEIIDADTHNGLWYKILGTMYLDKQMYGKALETFKTAIEYYPTNQNLFYLVGVCAGNMAKSSLDISASGKNTERERYLALAESAYLRAIELDKKNVRSLYALSVLYVFELNEPAKAIPLLELALGIDRNNIDIMFVLARAYYSTSAYDSALSMYDRILSSSKDLSRKKEAEANKVRILDETYGKN